MIGSGNIKAPFTKRLTCEDDALGCLAIGYSLQPQTGESPSVQKTKATITVEPTGGNSKLRVTVKVNRTDETGSALADLSYVYDGVSGGSGTVTAVCADLKSLVDALNDIPGITAFARHAPHSLSLAKDDFIALPETEIRNDHKYLECLYRDVSDYQVSVEGTGSKHVAYMRVGNPEERDRGSLMLMDLFGKGVATGTPLIRIYRDDVEDYGDDPEVLYRWAMVASSSGYLGDNKLEASDIICPFIIEATSTATLESNVDMNVKLVQSEM